jgi:hypothetical protein
VDLLALTLALQTPDAADMEKTDSPEPGPPRPVLTYFAPRNEQGIAHMDEDIIEKSLIDPNLSSYEKFFDHVWCKCIFEAVKTSPLIQAAGELILAWRWANGSHILPKLMVETLKHFAGGEMDGRLRYRADYAGDVVKGIVDKLEAKMQYSLKFDQRRALKRAVKKIEEEAHDDLKTARAATQFDVAGYWNLLITDDEFRFCILGTQRTNYANLFFAYEDFLANVIWTKEPTYSSKSKNYPISKAFAQHFGDQLTGLCWKHEEVDLARLVRNALAHNSGRFGKDLEKYKTRFVDATGMDHALIRGDQFNLVDGKIQITPVNTTHLFGVLKERVSRIVEDVK